MSAEKPNLMSRRRKCADLVISTIDQIDGPVLAKPLKTLPSDNSSMSSGYGSSKNISVSTQTPTDHMSFIFPLSATSSEDEVFNFDENDDFESFESSTNSESLTEGSQSVKKSTKIIRRASVNTDNGRDWISSIKESTFLGGFLHRKSGTGTSIAVPMTPQPGQCDRVAFSFDDRIISVGQQLRDIADEFDNKRMSRRRSYSLGQQQYRRVSL